MGELESWRHCPRCSANLEHEEASTKVECPNCGFRHYAHSEVTACAIIADDRKRVLLTRRAAPPFEGYWDLPGGFVGEAEHPHDALKRELREETGLEVKPRELLGIWIDRYTEGDRDDEGPATLNLYFTADAIGGEGRPSDDVAELRWTHPTEFPPNDELAFHIGDVLRVWRDKHA